MPTHDERTEDRGQSSASIFISYSSKDAKWAQEIRDILLAHRYTVWMAPDSIRGSKSWVDEIVDAVHECFAMIVVISSNSMASQHVSREVSIAVDDAKFVIPVRVTSAELSGSLSYLLRLVQWIDAFPPPLDRHAPELLRRLNVATGVRSGGAEEAVSTLQAASRGAPSRVRDLRRNRLWVPVAAATVTIVLAVSALLIAFRGPNSGLISGAPGRELVTSLTTAASATDRPTGGGSASHGSTAAPADVDSVLQTIPDRMSSMSELDGYIPTLAKLAGLPTGTPVSLAPRTSSTGSISLNGPDTWTDVDLSSSYEDSSDTVIGDFVIVAVNQSRLYSKIASGVAVGLAVPALSSPDSLDSSAPATQFLDLGCIDSALITVSSPLPGQVKVWAGCKGARIFVVGYFADATATMSLFCELTTVNEAAIAGQMLTSITLVTSKVRK